MINDNSRPLVFLGSNAAIWFLTDTCEQHGIQVAGIIDSDYFGNTDQIEGVPVIDTELVFADPERLAYYKNTYNFFIATNWLADRDPIQVRNRLKRQRLIDLIEQHDLPCISLVDQSAKVHRTTRIGRGVFVDGFAYVSAFNEIEDFVSIFAYSALGHHNRIGKNSVIQRQSGIKDDNVIESEVYIGLHSQIFGDHLTIASGTVIHPCMAIRRSTAPNEVVSLAGKDLRKIYHLASFDN